MSKTSEKRIHNRIDFNKPVQVFPVLPSKSGNIYEVQKESFEAQASDVSEGGLGLKVSKPMNPEFLVKMNFELTDKQPIEVYGKIIWSQSDRCGIRFMHTDTAFRKMLRSFS